MVHTALTENPTKKPAIFTSIQTTHHLSIKKSKTSCKKTLTFLHHQKIFFRSQTFTMKNPLKQFIQNQATISTTKRNQSKQKEGKRNIIWFNSPYSKSVKSNIGRIFIKLISKHFPPNNKLRIFNKNTIKLSYSCMPNIRSKITVTTKKILQPKSTEPQKLCNCCPVKEDFPMNGLCSTSSILYQATIKCSDSKYKQKR